MSDDTEWVYQKKTPEQIETLAWDITGGRVFGSWNGPPDMIKSCFMILMFMEQKHLDQLKEQNIAHLYEYMDKAGPRSVNGYPSFMSAQYIDVDDMAKVVKRLKQIEEFQRTTGP